MQNDFYITLANGNQWFIAPANMTIFHVSCFNNTLKTSNFDIITNSTLSVRSDCIVANGLTTFTPERTSNFTVVEFHNFSSTVELTNIPDNVLPKIHVDPVDTKNLFNEGIKLDQFHKKLIELEQEKRFQMHWQGGLTILTNVAYLCFFGLAAYLLLRFSSINCFRSICRILFCSFKSKQKNDVEDNPRITISMG